MKKLIIFHLVFCIRVFLSGFAHCQRPTATVNIAAVFSFDSVIGKAAKSAMEMAISDVNADPRILNETKLNLIMEDASCSVFLGSIGAFRALEEGVAAIIGPQSSSIARIISQISNGLHVPLISYAATDPTLSSLQFPFFFRTVQSDSVQMAAMADLIDFHGWTEVIAIFLDDDHGRNGISAFDDELVKRRLKSARKLLLSVHFDVNEITCLLNQSKVLGPRVYVVHLNTDPMLRFFTIAHKLQMMTQDYVWLTTDWLSVTLDSFSPVNKNASLSLLKGVVGLRPHIPDSSKKRTFVSKWMKMQKDGEVSSALNAFGFYAYDTIWAAASSIDKFIKVRKNISFSSYDNYNSQTEVTDVQLDKLKVFTGGSSLVDILLQSNFTGVSGQVQFKSDRNTISSGYEVINVNKMGITRVGYWSGFSGLSVIPPEYLQKKEQHGNFKQNQKLRNIIWPGGRTRRPRGWVIAGNARPLRIGVPKRASFVEFVTELPGTHQIQGYCIDIFKKALEFIPYDVPYVFKPFGDGLSNPSYDALVKMVADNVYDAVVGDIAIVPNRMRIADFSQPFATASLVIVAPVKTAKSSAWVFLKPFTADTWCAIAASFVMVGVVIWILEHRVNEDFRGPLRRQLATMFMFSLSTLFKANKENPVSALGKMVMITWLFLLMVITSSYTASLTSILTVQQLSSPITGIDSLIRSNMPIGFQVGSFAYSYLTQSLFIPRSRLVPLGSPEEYARALKKGPSGGGVAAIIDELPYVELFLSSQSEFGIIGQPFTRSTWGFAFQRESPLAIDMSTALLKLAENGELQKIREKWFCKMGCPEERSSSWHYQLHLLSFWALYLLCAVLFLIALLVFLLRTISQYVRFDKQRQNLIPSSSSSEPTSSSHCSHAVHRFLHFIDEKEEAVKKIFTQHDNPSTSTSSS